MIGIHRMVFVVLVSLAGLGMAAACAVRPAEGKLALLRPVSPAAVFGAVCASAAGFAMTFQRAAGAGLSPESTRVLLAGLAESWVPLIAAFALLSVAWLLVAFGLRRPVG